MVHLAEDDGGSPSCRVCLDPCTHAEFDSANACYLGCKCACGQVAMHTSCACKWFSSRPSLVCEVCCAEASGLPAQLKTAIRALELAAGTNGLTTIRIEPLPGPQSPSSPAGPGPSLTVAGRLAHGVLGPLLRPLPHPFGSVPTYLAAYAAFCLLPGLLFSLAMLFFSYRIIGAGIVLTMTTAVVQSSVTILHWVINPTRTAAHLLFVLMLMGCTASATMVCQVALSRMTANVHMALGALLGVLLSLLVQVYLIVPLLDQLTVLILSNNSPTSQSRSHRPVNPAAQQPLDAYRPAAPLPPTGRPDLMWLSAAHHASGNQLHASRSSQQELPLAHAVSLTVLV